MIEPVGPVPEALADILTRRRIAVGRDSGGRVVVARPDSVLVGVGDSVERRDRIATWVGGWDHDQAERIAETPSERSLRFATIRFPAGYFDDSAAPLAGVSATLDQLAASGHHVELNHVVLGATSVGSIVGAPARRVGDMVFTGQAASTAAGESVLRTSAQPAMAPRFLRQALQLPDRRPPKVLVMDSGLRTVGAAGEAPEHPDLASCFVHEPWLLRPEDREVDDEDESDVDRTGTLDFQAGHGTFVSGIVRQICPDAELHTCGVLTSFGEGSVSGVLRAFSRVTNLSGPFDVVVMSFGAYFTNDDPGLFAGELTRLLGEAVAVGSAGNDYSSRPYFPAALPNVIGVGGLAANEKAWFTNFGSWVDACAPAVDVVSTFFADITESIGDDPLRHYDGWARWSGTSFAAPKVAALIAQEMYLHGDDAGDAWKRLTSNTQLRYGDLGIVFNA